MCVSFLTNRHTNIKVENCQAKVENIQPFTQMYNMLLFTAYKEAFKSRRQELQTWLEKVEWPSQLSLIEDGTEKSTLE